MTKPKHARVRTKKGQAGSLERVVRRLMSKYENKRGKYWRWSVKATKRKDMDGQLIYGALQLAYTEMQTDLEQLLEPSNT